MGAVTEFSERIPSLQRILALDKTLPQFDDQLNEVCSILKINSLLLEPKEHLNRQKYGQSCVLPHTGLILRWLLDKLHSSLPVGRDARKNPRSWTILGCLLSSKAITEVSSLQKLTSFLEIFQRALQESFTDCHIQNAEVPIQSFSGGKKRKRGGIVVKDRSPELQLRDVSETCLSLFNAMRSTLTTVISISIAGMTGATGACVHMQKVLTASSSRAADLLRLWCLALESLPTAREDWILVHDLQRHGPVSSPLSPMIDVWTLSERSNPKDDAILAFARTSLVPVLNLLQNLSPGELRSTTVVARRELESLVASQIILPARDIQLCQGLEACSTRLDSWFEPLTQLQSDLTGSHTQSSHRDIMQESALQLVPLLWSVALRTTLRVDQRKKTIEESWLLTLFRSLAKCAGFPLDPDSPVQSGNTNVQCLITLFDMAMEHQFQIDSDVLRIIIEKYSGLAQVYEAVNWNLVIAVIRMDASIFLVQGANVVKNSESTRTIGDALFNSLSIATKDPDPEEFSLEQSLKRDVLVPIVNVHASTKNLERLIQRWHAEIVRSLTDANDTKELSKSLWESSVLRESLLTLLEQSLSSKQLTRLLSIYMDSLGKEAENYHTTSSSAKRTEIVLAINADVVILDAITEGLIGDQIIDELLPVILQIYDLCVAVFEEHKMRDMRHMDKSWRLLSKMETMVRRQKPQSPSTAVQEPVMELSRAAVTMMKLNVAPNDRRALDTRNEALEYTLNVLTAVDPGSETHNYLLSSIETVFATLIPTRQWTITDSSLSPSRLPSDEVVCRSISALLSHPSVLEMFSRDVRGRIFKETMIRAYEERIENPGESSDGCISNLAARYRLLLESFRDLGLSTGYRNTLAGICTVSKSAIDAACKIFQEKIDRNTMTAANRIASIQCDLFLPVDPSAIPRETREHLLDAMTSWMCNKASLAHTTISKALALLVHLMVVPNATSKVCLDAEYLFQLSHTISLDINASEQVSMYRMFIHMCIYHVANTIEQQRSKRMIESLRELTYRGLSQSEHKKLSPGCLILYSSVASLWSVHGSGPNREEAELLIGLLLSATRAATSKSESGLPLHICTIQDILAALTSTREISDTSQGKIQGIYAKLDKSRRKVCLSSRAFQQCAELVGPNSASTESAIYDCCALLTSGAASAQTQMEALDVVQKTLSQSDVNFKATLATSLSTVTVGQSTLTTGQLRILAILLSTLEKSSTTSQTYTAFIQSIATLCTLLPQSIKTGTFALTVSCLLVPLRSKVFLMSQSAIDALLSALLTASHPSHSSLKSNTAGPFYTGLCTLTHATILLHRTRLGGRYHILTAILQNLITALHTPLSPTSSHVQHTNDLTSKHASVYTRILTTLCSPTQSSVVRQRRSRDALVDETKVAKTYAGEYVGDVISAFCAAQLDGTLERGMREALESGLWAAMDVIGEEGLKTLSSSLNTNTRAVLRGLVANWKKFGRSENR
ncbi:hypothetical protein EJ05DRAFT_471688 [Pseudovirgaria hyperparasitica]|uniref:Nucleolar 27S pre-rRNA processing Urb2/Npa2 C-terminal domain-containing protein n=1 Tax=Pseudovirgaria hyperparasitica TaxID=470096 RepID=A0A6A6WKN8_9PEZI|nr:uncharacterized protein EJ05DRAFT_471688 [Pseudovirgaria hyperparasitica]KAF2762737.1 hypothetical protein EJ05DRAFT_471688 [Pseudovirgaria hyperparasitica]